MTANYKQSALREVRDQMLLDYADGKYLNTVSANLGLTRPLFGFSDTQWRAIAKVLGLNYKQVHTQFERLFEILFGPQVTQYSGLAEDFVPGDLTLTLNNTEGWPQTGTLVLDRGQATEEEVEYCLIDRYTNTVYLNSTATYSRVANTLDASSQLVLPATAGDLTVVLGDTSQFPLSYPYTVTLGVGTAVEEAIVVLDNNIVSNTLTIQDPLANSHVAVKPTATYSLLSKDYVNGTYFLSLLSTEKFPDKGTVLVGEAPLYATAGVSSTTTTVVPGGSLNADQDVGRVLVYEGNVTPALAGEVATVTTNTDSVFTHTVLPAAPAVGDRVRLVGVLTAVGGTPTTVDVAAATWTTDLHVGDQITFVGNVTSALSNSTVNVIAATDMQATFSAALPAPPVAGDYFYIRPRIQFFRNAAENNVLVVHRDLEASLPHGTKVELLSTDQEVGYAPVQTVGTNWDVLQNDPRHVELFLPDELNDPDTLRTASYLHDRFDTPVSTTLTSPASPGDTTLEVASTAGLAPEWAVTLDGTQLVGVSPRYQTQFFTAAGSTNPVTGAVFSVAGLTPGSLVGTRLFVGDGWSGLVASNTAITITLAEQVPASIFDALVSNLDMLAWYDPTLLDLQSGAVVASPALVGASVVQTAPVWPGTDLQVGDVWNEDNVWPGPYVYDLGEFVGSSLTTPTTLGQSLAGPLKLVVDQLSMRTALEVEDASYLPLTGFPYAIILGANAGSREQAEVQDISLAQQTNTTTAVAAPIGQPFVEVASLGVTIGARFVNADGYRVLVGRGTANEEVLYVTGVDGTVVPEQLLCEPTTNVHGVGESIELLADVLDMANLANDHKGYIGLGQRTTRWPSITSNARNAGETLQPLYNEVLLNSVTGLDTAGEVFLNMGNQVVPQTLVPSGATLVGATALVYGSTAALPTVYPYFLTVGKGTSFEEVVTVTNNDGVNTVTISPGLRFAHSAEDVTEYKPGTPEVVGYSSLVANSLRFSSSLMLQSNHHIGEPAIGATLLTDLDDQGYDFPLRMPYDIRDRIEFLFDILRAAGVQVSIIDKK